MTNNENKKIKVPGILIVFILTILGGFSGLTYAVTGSVSGPDLSFAKNGLVNLLSAFDTEIIIESNITDNIIAEEILEETASPIPTPTPTIEPKPKLKLKAKLTPIPSPSPSMDSALQSDSGQASPSAVSSWPNGSPLPSVATPTPTPTLMPTPTITPTPAPAHLVTICSTPPLTYRIRYIDGVFYQNNLDREKLNKIALYAESQWELATSADLFKNEDNNLNANAIDFTNNTSVKYNDEEAGQFGIAIKSDSDKNGLMDKFQMTIFREIFYLINSGNAVYIGEPNKNYNLEESITTRAVMHQMGHVLGLAHLPDGQTGIMSASWIPTTYKPTLSQDDIKQIKELCK